MGRKKKIDPSERVTTIPFDKLVLSALRPFR